MRMRNRLHRRHPVSVPAPAPVLLPRQAALFSGTLLLSLPAEMQHAASASAAGLRVFRSKTSALSLTVMRLPFARRLTGLSAIDLQIAFRQMISPQIVPVIRHGFLHHAPTITAEWDGKEKTVLRLIQTGKTVYLLLFENVTPDTADAVAAMLFAASIAV